MKNFSTKLDWFSTKEEWSIEDIEELLEVSEKVNAENERLREMLGAITRLREPVAAEIARAALAVEALDEDVERILAAPDAEITDDEKSDAALTEALCVSMIYSLQSLNGDDLTRDQLLIVQLRSHLELVKIEHKAQLDAAVAAARAETREACARYHETEASWLRDRAADAAPDEWEWLLHQAERHETDAAAIREGK